MTQNLTERTTNNKIAPGYIFAVLLSLTVMATSHPSAMNFYASIALFANLFFILVAFFFIRSLSLSETVYISVTAAYLSFSITFSGGGLGSLITFLTAILLFYVFSRATLTQKTKLFITALLVCHIILLFVYSFPYNDNWNSWQQNSLTAINPNTLGIFLMFAFMIVAVFCDLNNKVIALLVSVLFFITAFAIYNYRARGTLLTLICFGITLILPKKLFSRKSFFFGSLALIILGTLVPFFYLFAYNHGIDLRFLGKSLYTGREKLWSEMLSLFDDFGKVLFGLGSKISLGGSTLNTHNNFFNYIVDFGIIGFALNYGFILYQIWLSAKHNDNPTVRKSLCMFICSVIILGFSETTSMWAVIFPFAYFGLITAKAESLKLQKNFTLLQKNKNDT